MKRALIICDSGDATVIPESCRGSICDAMRKFDVVVSAIKFPVNDAIDDGQAQCSVICSNASLLPRSAFFDDDGVPTGLIGMLTELGVAEVSICGIVNDDFLVETADDCNSFFKTVIIEDYCQGLSHDGIKYLVNTGCSIIQGKDIPEKGSEVEIDIEDLIEDKHMGV